MSAAALSPCCPVQSGFLSVLPRLLLHARICFRDRRADRREEAVAEVVALSWKWYVGLVQRGKDPSQFPSALATFATRAVQAGRRLGGQERAGDVLSPRARQCRGFTVGSYSEWGRHCGVFEEALRDNTQTPPDQQACFRLDFQAWAATLSRRDRAMMLELASGERTQEVARRSGLSPARVSQKRRQLRDAWRRYCGEEPNRPGVPGQGVPCARTRPSLPTALASATLSPAQTAPIPEPSRRQSPCPDRNC